MCVLYGGPREYCKACENKHNNFNLKLKTGCVVYLIKRWGLDSVHL